MANGMNTRSKGKGLFFFKRPEQDLQAFLIDSEHFAEILPLLPQLLPKATAFIERFNHSPAKLDLLLLPYAKPQVRFQLADVGRVQEGQSALQVGRRDLLDKFQQKGRLFLVLEGLDYLLAVLQVFVPCLYLPVLELLRGVLLDHHLIHILLGLVASDGLVVCLLPNPKASVESSGDDEVSGGGDGKGANFEDVVFEVHDEFVRVSVPKLDVPVLAAADHVVGLVDELNGSHGLAVGEQRLDGVPEVQVPETDVLISAAGDEQCVVGGDVEGVDGQFMAVEFEAVLVGVCVLDVDLRVLEVDCVLIEGVAVHGRRDLIFEVLVSGLSHPHPPLGICADFEYAQFVLPPQQALAFLHPAPRPLLLHSVDLLVLRQVPDRHFLALHHHQEPAVEQGARDRLLGDREEVVEGSVVVDLNVSIVSLDQEGELKLDLLRPIVRACDLPLFVQKYNVAAVIQEYFPIEYLIIVNFVKQSFFLQW